MDGYVMKQYSGPVKRYCQMLDLRRDAELIAQYRKVHSREGVWPEILEGIRSVGILEMEIYQLGERCIMIVETPVDFDWESAMKRLATLSRQAEWEAFVSQFQQASAEAASDEKWQMMERIFHLY